MRDEVSTYQDEVETLALLVTATEANALAFALYRSVADREPAVRALKEKLSLPVDERPFTRSFKNPFNFLSALPESPRRCVFFYDAEEAFPEFLGYVNLQRERFRDCPHAVVFWVTEHGMREIAGRAPDFWHWPRGVFDFRGEHERMRSLGEPFTIPAAFAFRDRGDLERRVSLYQGLLQEYAEKPDADDGFLGRIHNQLGVALRELNKLRDAAHHAEIAAHRAKLAQDSSTLVDALTNMGLVAVETGRTGDASKHFREALNLLSKDGDATTRAVIFHNLGRIAEGELDLDTAKDWYQKSLDISKRMNQAATLAGSLNGLASVAAAKGQLEDARQLVLESIEIAERNGIERYAAAGYHNLGLLAVRQQRLAEAEELTRKASEMRQRIGLPGELIASAHQLGIIAQMRGHSDEAEEHYKRSLELGKQFDCPVLTVLTIAAYGVLCRQLGRFAEAIKHFARALKVAQENELPSRGRIVMDLAETVQSMDPKASSVALNRAAADIGLGVSELNKLVQPAVAVAEAQGLADRPSE